MTDKTPDAIATLNATAADDKPFWRTKRLDEMTRAEWESLCDGCARCCLNKLEDWDTGEIIWTNVACSLLDSGSCRCKDYDNRLATVPDCVPLDPETVSSLSWLPPTCAYRLLDEGYDLYWWHPLVSGDPDTIHQAGISVRGRVVSEDGMEVEDYENHLASWPGEDADDEPVLLKRD
ncbi:YcgN family cysteine cluster protein [uncultured Cohaesibacter sp.]|uniref:YcgN family cysteine cluster protein n=1 Tax=uncultured Cohaesibacter sp. TaxID=1002546 RepID=UPI0029C869D9|nr:YcgN family cysteine cluster protein [uncultured Cohaesibacter sp.]